MIFDLFLILAVGLVFGAIIGFNSGWKAREVAAFRVIEEHKRAIQQRPVVGIRFEKIGNVFYVYNAETQEFLCQGETEQEVKRLLIERSANTTFMATTENCQEVGFRNDSV